MSRSKRNTIACVAAGSCVLASLSLGPWPGASAQATFPDPNANCPPAECGQVSPLIPMQSVEAVHSRFPQYIVNDMADPELVDLAIQRGALTTAGNQFNTSLRDVIHGFDSPAAPFLGLRPTDCTAGDPRPTCAPDDSFQRLTYGGYTMRQGLS